MILAILVLITASTFHLPVNDSIHDPSDVGPVLTASLHLPVNDSIHDLSDVGPVLKASLTCL